MFTIRKLKVGALILILAVPWGCFKRAGPEEPSPEAPDYVPSAFLEELESPAPLPDVRFKDVTSESGIRFLHENGSFGRKFLPETMGSGVALFNFDGDDLLDIFFVNGRHWQGYEDKYPQKQAPATMALYRNRGGLRFDDITAEAGLSVQVMGMGAAAAYIDGDGDPDLFVTAVGKNLFFRNDGLRFTECTQEAGLVSPSWLDEEGHVHGSWGTSCAFLDFDLDGRIDLFVANYERWSLETDIFTTLDGTRKAFTTPELYPGDSCRLYRNIGGLRFEDVTKRAGIFHPEGKSLGVAIEDVNRDGWDDIIVSNDTQPNYLFRNNQNGTFTEIGLASGIAYSPQGRARAGMGIDTARDGGFKSLSIVIGNFSREPVSVYREVARCFFQDEEATSRIGPSTLISLTFGLLFLDYDLDGLSDLCFTNGHIEPSIQEVHREITYAQPPQIFFNQGRGRFREASNTSGDFFSRPGVGRGLAAGDLDGDGDGDGDLDLVFTQNGGPANLLRCDSRSSNRSIRLHLRGEGQNLDALGARVRLQVKELEMERTVRTGSSYLSQSELALTFGMGNAVSAGKIEVIWPDGSREIFQDIPAGKSYLVQKGEGKLSEIPRRR